MNFVKRIALFLALNFLVVLTVSLILGFLNVGPHISVDGYNIQDLALFCLVWGMVGALISLSLSRIMAKWMMGVRLIDSVHCNAEERRLLDLVHRLAERADLPKMPEVGIYNSPEVNAFATGPTKSRSLVAVSSGLLNRMNEKELEGVLAHEVTHIANGDMVTMTLLQGVVNAFVMFLARLLALALSNLGKGDKKQGSYASYRLFVILFEIIFMGMGSLIIAAYSRFREFRADKGGAHLAGRQAMISALQSLQRLQNVQDPRQEEKQAMAAFKISYRDKGGLLRLFATHPPLEERIARLELEG
jgi:heat shock protein HtpX